VLSDWILYRYKNACFVIIKNNALVKKIGTAGSHSEYARLRNSKVQSSFLNFSSDGRPCLDDRGAPVAASTDPGSKVETPRAA
jgi:hypothetical protein